jgi:hypothetical protein
VVEDDVVVEAADGIVTLVSELIAYGSPFTMIEGVPLAISTPLTVPLIVRPWPFCNVTVLPINCVALIWDMFCCIPVVADKVLNCAISLMNWVSSTGFIGSCALNSVVSRFKKSFSVSVCVGNGLALEFAVELVVLELIDETDMVLLCPFLPAAACRRGGR